VIANAWFKTIKRRDAGKVIQFDDSKDGIARYSVDSWSEELLCDPCEQYFSDLEKYACETLREASAGKAPSEGALLRDIDYRKLKRFFTSLLWRAAVSTLVPFAKVNLPGQYVEELRKSLRSGKALPPRQLACRLQRVFDPRPANQGGFKTDALEHFIISPIPRLSQRDACFLFLLGGYLLEIFVPSPSLHEWRTLGMLKDDTKLFAPAKNIFDVPEIRKLLLAGHTKQALGLQADNLKRRR